MLGTHIIQNARSSCCGACISSCFWLYSLFFFFNDTATTEIYTLSLHDALPISRASRVNRLPSSWLLPINTGTWLMGRDRKSTRLNSSHVRISYAVFCLKKKNQILENNREFLPCGSC